LVARPTPQAAARLGLRPLAQAAPQPSAASGRRPPAQPGAALAAGTVRPDPQPGAADPAAGERHGGAQTCPMWAGVRAGTSPPLFPACGHEEQKDVQATAELT